MDKIGTISNFALSKGYVGKPRLFNGTPIDQPIARLDSAALDNICAVIKSELDKIIKLQEQKLLLAAYPNPGQPEVLPTPPR